MLNRVEQLETQLEAAELASRERVDALNALAWELWTTDRNRSISLYEEAFRLAGKLNYERGIVFSNLNKGARNFLEDVEESLPLLLDVLAWFEEHTESEGQAHANAMLGILFWGIGDYQRGFNHATHSLELYESIEDWDGHSWAHHTLGGFHYDLKDHEAALQHFQEAEGHFRKLNNPIGEARAINGVGNIYHAMGDHEAALACQKRSLKLQRTHQHPMSESRTLNDLGLIYESLGDYKKAESFLREGLKLRDELQYRQGQTTSLLDLGSLLIRLKRHDEARECLLQALLYSREIKAMPKVCRAYELLALLEEEQGKFRQALNYQRLFSETQSRVDTETSEKRLSNLRKSFEIETARKEAEIYRVKSVELKEKNELLRKTLHNVNANQAHLIQTGKMAALGKLVAGIAHEINSPLAIIKSNNDIADRVARRLEQSGDAKHTDELIAAIGRLKGNIRNAGEAIEQIVSVIRSLKNFARLDEAGFQKADIHEGLDSTLALVRYSHKDRIQIHRNFGDLPLLFCFPTELNQVFLNLILNAIEATPDGGQVCITTTRTSRNAVIAITDSGSGIQPEVLREIFEPSYVQDEENPRLRTGLYSSRKIIEERHRGRLHVKTGAARGTTFAAIIPLDLDRIVADSRERIGAA